MSKKFLFDTSFEPQDMATRASAIPLADHTVALQKEYDKGVQQGSTETQAGIDARNTEQLQDLNIRLITLLEEQKKYREKVQTLVAGILQKSLEKLFPVMAKEKGINEVLQVVSKTFETTPPGREIKIFAHPDTVNALQKKLNSLQENPSQTLIFTVQADEKLSFSDCRITWEGGGLERLSSRLYQEIDTCLERLSVTETITLENSQEKSQEKSQESQRKDSTVDETLKTTSILKDHQKEEDSVKKVIN